jgi:DNA polymerase-3 subunit gamma/tau
VMENGHDPRRFAADVLERLRDLVVLDAVPEAGEKGLLDCPPEQLASMARQATNLGTAGLSRAADLFHAGLTEMRGTTSPRLLLELVCARVLLPAASSDGAAVLTRLERLERRFDIGGTPEPAAPLARAAAPAPVPPVSPPPAAPVAAPAPSSAPPARSGSPRAENPASSGAWPAAAVPGAPVTTPVPAPEAAPSLTPPAAAGGGLDATALRRSWDAVLQAANERKRVTKALLDNAQVLDLTGRTLTLAFTTAALSRQFQAGSNLEVLKESLQAVLGLDVDIALVVAGEQPPLAAASRAPEPAQASPAYEGFAPGDEIDPEDPEAPRHERQVGGEDAALKLVADQLGGTVVGTVEP